MYSKSCSPNIIEYDPISPGLSKNERLQKMAELSSLSVIQKVAQVNKYFFQF